MTLAIVNSLSVDPSLMPWAILCTALAVAWFAFGLISIAFAPRYDVTLDVFEQKRRATLRAASLVYRWFEPLVDELSEINSNLQISTVEKLRSSFSTLREFPPWKPGEYISVSQLTGIAIGVGCVVVLGAVNPMVGAIVGVIIPPVIQISAVGKAHDCARQRARQIKLRFPYALDLLVMMMSAGLVFERSLNNVVKCSVNHPLGAELAELLQQIELGITPREAFRTFGQLYDDDDIREFVTNVIQGVDLGTPLGTIFRVQADQMRLKRSQWIEKAAAQAEVQITGPGLVVGVACMLILLAPFLLAVKDAF